MNATIVRVGVYSGFTGVIIGTVFGIAVSTIEPRGPRSGESCHAGGFDVPSIARAEGEAESGSRFDLSNLTIPVDQLLRGGPPKDGIPALAEPKIGRAAQAEFLSPDDRIVAVTKNEESRAYPIRMLNWHEIVNDTLGGVPIAVVYCPLCDSVTVVDRRIAGETVEFGVSGLLYQSNVLMYDRTHDALWSQILLEAVSGPHAGKSLTHYSGWAMTTFERWKGEHPSGTVVTFETGHQRNYGRSPYDDYMVNDALYFPVKRADDRLGQKDRIIGVRVGDLVRAYPLAAVHEAPSRRLRDVMSGGEVIIEADEKSGYTAVLKVPDGAHVIHTFWFSWAAVHPETEIYGAR